MQRDKLEKYERVQQNTDCTTIAGFQNPREEPSADTPMWQQLQEEKKMRVEISRLIAEMVVSRASHRNLPRGRYRTHKLVRPSSTSEHRKTQT